MERFCFPILLATLGGTASAQGWETLADVPVDMTFPVVVALEGAIHVIGGGANGGATDLHLRYTPATDTWDTLAPVPYLAQQPCGAVVDGKIHFSAGGYPNTGTPLDDHYTYDPALDEWSAAANLPFPTAINEAVGLDGKFYVLTGQPDKTLCQYYDPGTDSWHANNPLPDLNFWYGVVVASSQTIYRFGGGGYITPTNVAHEYDKVNDSWNVLPDLNGYLHAAAGTLIGDSIICISGGYWNAETDAVWLYDIADQTYQPADPLPLARSYHSMVTIDGCVYSVGGNGFQPEIGVSLLRNCLFGAPDAIEPVASGDERPYSATITPDHLLLQFSASALEPLTTIRIVDALGRTVLSSAADGASGRFDLDGGNLTTGRYSVVISVGSRRFVEDWVIAHY